MRELIRKLRRWAKREEMLAIPDGYLDEWLDNIGLLASITDGKVLCEMCNERIDKDNLEIVGRFEDRFVVVCSNPACTREFLTVRRGETE